MIAEWGPHGAIHHDAGDTWPDVENYPTRSEISELDWEIAQAEAETRRQQAIDVAARHAAWVKAGCPGRRET